MTRKPESLGFSLGAHARYHAAELMLFARYLVNSFELGGYVCEHFVNLESQARVNKVNSELLTFSRAQPESGIPTGLLYKTMCVVELSKINSS